MVDILHTADVHLADDAPERRAALATLLDRAQALEVAVVTIGGDLFHAPEDVQALRPSLRNELFSDQPFDIVVIPGNHDAGCFRDNTFFGDACRAITTTPFEHITLDDQACRITAVPFLPHLDEETFLQLADRESFEGTEILLIHCTLDVGFSRADTGGEDEHRYCPVTPDQLGQLEFDYVLAGHYHQPQQVSLSAGTFAYPGTPASTRQSETGARQAVTIDLEAAELGFERLDTFHYARETFEVLPGGEEALFAEIESWVQSTLRAETAATVHVEGFHELDEASFHERLSTAAGAATLVDETTTARRLRRHPLYEAFETRLEDREWDESTSDALRLRTLSVLNDVRGEL